MIRPFELRRRELAAWAALVLSVPLLIWIYRSTGSNADSVRIVRPDSGTAESPVQARLDLNRASVEELQLLPGIGPQRARRILAYRQQHGCFRSVRDLAELPGFSPALVERLTPMLTVTTVAPAEP